MNSLSTLFEQYFVRMNENAKIKFLFKAHVNSKWSEKVRITYDGGLAIGIEGKVR